MGNSIKFLQNHKFFLSLNKTQLELINELANEITYDEGQMIIDEGDKANELYIVKEGEVEVLKNQEGGNQFSLATLKSGAVIGEMSLLEDIPRAASIRALTHSVLLCFSIPELRKYKNAKTCEERAIYYVPAEQIAHELCLRLRAANQTMVEFMHTDQLEAETTVAGNTFFANLFRI